LDAAGFGKHIVPFPVKPVVFALKVLEFLKLSPLYPWIYETASKDSFVSIDKAQKTIGYKPQYSNKQAMLRNYDWYLKNKTKLTGESGVSHRLPWKQKALKLLKVFF
jgi:dTDP-D-glucose 4,6-dehydratase